MKSIDYEHDNTVTYDFSTVLDGLKEGHSYGRMGWSGDDRIKLQIPGFNSKMNRPYIYMVTDHNEVVPYTPSTLDILSSDWYQIT